MFTYTSRKWILKQVNKNRNNKGKDMYRFKIEYLIYQLPLECLLCQAVYQTLALLGFSLSK